MLLETLLFLAILMSVTKTSSQSEHCSSTEDRSIYVVVILHVVGKRFPLLCRHERKIGGCDSLVTSSLYCDARTREKRTRLSSLVDMNVLLSFQRQDHAKEESNHSNNVS
jgi:hypothetical protein